MGVSQFEPKLREAEVERVSRMVRGRLFHFSMVLMIGFSVAFCLMAVLRAQAWLNRQAEMSLNPADAAPQTDAKMVAAAVDEAAGSAGKPLPSMAVAEVGLADVFVIDRKRARGTMKSIRSGMLVIARPSSDKYRGEVEADTSGSVLTEGKKEPTAHVVDRRSDKAHRAGLAGREAASEHEDASVASVSVHRLGREPTVYRVPKE